MSRGLREAIVCTFWAVAIGIVWTLLINGWFFR